MQQDEQQTVSSNIDENLSSFATDSFSIIDESFAKVPNPSGESQTQSELKEDCFYEKHSSDSLDSPISGDIRFDAEHLKSSHFALSTAYEKLKRKLAQSELENLNLLKKQQILDSKMASSTPMSSSGHNSMSQQSYSNDEISRAWEAYNEKCRECEQMRDDLRMAKQTANNTEQSSVIQSLQEALFREKARFTDLEEQLNLVRSSADQKGKKEIMAREELEKEREYQQNLVAATEKKHHEMQSRIDELENLLEKETESKNQVLRGQNTELRKQAESFNRVEDQYKSKVRMLEEKVIELQENINHIQQQQQQNNMHELQNQRNKNDGNIPNDSESEHEMIVIMNELKNLTTELQNLKQQSKYQAVLLNNLHNHPIVGKLLRSIQIGKEGSSVDAGLKSMTIAPADSPNESMDTLEFSVPGSSNFPSSAPQNIGPSNGKTPVVKRTDEFIRSLSRASSKRSSSEISSSTNGARFQQLPVVGISRVIHNPVTTPNPFSFPANRPSSSNRPDSSGIYYNAPENGLNPTSLSSDEGNNSMPTLQPSIQNLNQEDLISSDEDNTTKDQPSTSQRSPETRPRPSIRAKSKPPQNFPPIPISKPVPTPANRPRPDFPVTQPTNEATPMQPQPCPVCNKNFLPGTTEATMNKHINSHFSDDEDDFLDLA